MEKCNKDCENCPFYEEQKSVCLWFLQKRITWNFETQEMQIPAKWFDLLF